MRSIEQIESVLGPAVLNELMETARSVAAQAHAPYSHFHVGAAVLDNQGRIFGGCNVENASFGLTMCAERNAVGAAVSAGAGRIVAIAIYTATESLTPPCGACRQVLSEFGPQAEVHLFNHEGQHKVFALDQLLPACFTLEREAVKGGEPA
jgi:cytidine deaminase